MERVTDWVIGAMSLLLSRWLRGAYLGEGRAKVLDEMMELKGGEFGTTVSMSEEIACDDGGSPEFEFGLGLRTAFAIDVGFWVHVHDNIVVGTAKLDFVEEKLKFFSSAWSSDATLRLMTWDYTYGN